MTPTDVDGRAPTAFETREEPGTGIVEVFPLPTDEATLLAILHTVFDTYWPHVQFGTLIQGAVFEITASAPPRLGMLDGYVTVDLGASHLHVCIGPHRGPPDHPVDVALARHRRCARAELYRILQEGDPVSWGVRLFNGADEQQLTIMLPNPFLDDHQQPLPSPDWDRLACWNELRTTYLGLGPDSRDRRGTRFHHG